MTPAESPSSSGTEGDGIERSSAPEQTWTERLEEELFGVEPRIRSTESQCGFSG